jgi:hypothetical protein
VKGEKSLLLPLTSSLTSGYLLVLSPPTMPTAANPSATIRNFARTTNTTNDVSKVTILDVENKFIACTGALEGVVSDAWELGGKVGLAMGNGKVCRYQSHTNHLSSVLFFVSSYSSIVSRQNQSPTSSIPSLIDLSITLLSPSLVVGSYQSPKWQRFIDAMVTFYTSKEISKVRCSSMSRQ